MIRTTVVRTQAATFSIELPNAYRGGMPSPTGTGFFVSPDGWFVTAAHVIKENGKVRTDIPQGIIRKESRAFDEPPIMCQTIQVMFVDDPTDFALLKIDFKVNASAAWLKGRKDFPFIQVSSRSLSEGEPVYSFGYPLSESRMESSSTELSVASATLRPRVTSAIVASSVEKTGMVMSPRDVKHYVLDKALTYGNSGGPIVSTDTGFVHAFCSRFDLVPVRQPQLGNNAYVSVPSLYCVVPSLSNDVVMEKLRTLGVPIETT